jgi:hypothetical protein
MEVRRPRRRLHQAVIQSRSVTMRGARPGFGLQDGLDPWLPHPGRRDDA